MMQQQHQVPHQEPPAEVSAHINVCRLVPANQQQQAEEADKQRPGRGCRSCSKTAACLQANRQMNLMVLVVMMRRLQHHVGSLRPPAAASWRMLLLQMEMQKELHEQLQVGL
ncbi:hypothetical protein ACK3TF_001846 [Chlorella vulgaris]